MHAVRVEKWREAAGFFSKGVSDQVGDGEMDSSLFLLTGMCTTVMVWWRLNERATDLRFKIDSGRLT